jgi:transcription elongation factor Elf1
MQVHAEKGRIFMKKVNVVCKGITVNERVKPREEVAVEPKLLRCPKCNGKDILSYVTVYARAIVDVNNYRVDELLDAEFDDPTEVEIVNCFDCEHKWEVEAVVVNGLYEYKSKGAK